MKLTAKKAQGHAEKQISGQKQEFSGQRQESCAISRSVAQHDPSMQEISPLLKRLAEGGNQPFCSTEVRAKNGRANAASRDKRLWLLKQKLGHALKSGYVTDTLKEKMRARMDVFGQFSRYL